MTARITWFICLLNMLNAIALSQDTTILKTRHYISFQSGYSSHMVQDEIVSPLIYKGSQLPLTLGYSACKKKSIQSLSIFYDYLKLKSSISIDTPYEAFYTTNYNAFLYYSYTRNILTFPNFGVSLYAGGELKCQLNFRDHYYSNYTHYTTGELITSIGFTIDALKKFSNAPNDMILFQFFIPFLSYDMLNYLYNTIVPKDFHSTNGDENTNINLTKTSKLATFNNYFEIQAEIAYYKLITKSLGIKVSYYFQYYSSVKYANLIYSKYVNNQILIGLIVKF